MFETGGVKIIVDPYLSNRVEKVVPSRFAPIGDIAVGKDVANAVRYFATSARKVESAMRKKEIVFAAIITLFLAAGDLFAFPMGLFLDIHIADIEPMYFTFCGFQSCYTQL